MRKLAKLFLRCQVFALLVFLGNSAVTAAGLTVSPANNYIQLNGGERQLLLYNLKNETTQDFEVTLDASSFAAGVNGEPQLQAELAFPYFSLAEASSETNIILPAGANRDFTVIVEPPFGVINQEYPLTLFFQLTPVNSETNKSTVITNLGTNLIVLVSESNLDKSRLSVKDFSWPKIVDSFLPAPIKVLIENQGGNAALLYGKIILQRRSGKVVTEREFYPDLVLAQSTRQARWKLPADAQGTISLSDQFDLPQFLFGSYQIKIELASLHPNSLEQTTTVMANFFALPYRLLLTVILVIVIVWLFKRKKPRLSRREADELFTQKMASIREQSEKFESKF
ncbi:MAG: hypothetical protein Q4G02_01170 [bacterium]|nr:hypothetical protein [bacterium]